MNVIIRNMLAISMILLASSFNLQQAQAQESDSAALIAIIDAVEKGWEQGDGQQNLLFRHRVLTS